MFSALSLRAVRRRYVFVPFRRCLMRWQEKVGSEVVENCVVIFKAGKSDLYGELSNMNNEVFAAARSASSGDP